MESKIHGEYTTNNTVRHYKYIFVITQSNCLNELSGELILYRPTIVQWFNAAPWEDVDRELSYRKFHLEKLVRAPKFEGRFLNF